MAREVSCPECGSEKVRVIQNGVIIEAYKFKKPDDDVAETRGDLYVCTNCKERFITGLGFNSKEWGKEFEKWR